MKEYITVPKNEFETLRKRLKRLEKKVKRLEKHGRLHSDTMGRIEASIMKLSELGRAGVSVRDLQRSGCQGIDAASVRKGLRELMEHNRVGSQSSKAKNGHVINYFYILGA